MAAPRPPRIGVVLKRSSWQLWVEERRDARVKRLLAQGDPTVASLRAAHEEHTAAVREVEAALEAMRARATFVTDPQNGFDASPFDLVVTVGGDGTLLSASHSVGDTPILAINSAPSHSVGFFCGAQLGSVEEALDRAVRGTLRRTVLTRMQVAVNGRVVAARVLNDALFCHASPAATSRYLVQLGDIVEEQKSSGFWIGPAAGSTAAQRSAGGRVLPLTSQRLQLVVREPYTPHGERYRLRHALVPPGGTLVVRSKMHDAKLFFDGPNRSTDVAWGDVVELTRAEQPLVLLGISARRRWA